MKKSQKTILLMITTLLLSQCWMGQDAPRDNLLDPFRGSSPSVVEQGLENWWKFNNSYNDEKSNIFANPAGSYNYITDRFNVASSAMSFQATGNLDLTNVSKFEIDGTSTTQFTIEVWLLRTNDATTQNLVKKGTAPNCISDLGYYMNISSFGGNSNKLEFFYSTATCYIFEIGGASFSLNKNIWYHLFIEFSGISTNLNVEVFVAEKDKQQFSTAFSASNLTPFTISPASNFIIGDDGLVIDDLRYYNRILSLEEKLQNHSITQ